MLRQLLQSNRFLLPFVVACGFAQAAELGGAATVRAVQATRVADLVLLDGGYDVALRQGMLCRVSRGEQDIGEILLVKVRASLSAALIVDVAPRQSIRAGDRVQVKLLKT